MDSNPYQSPQVTELAIEPGESGGTGRFLPPRTLVVPLLYACAVASLLNLAANGMQFGLLSRAAAGATIGDDEAMTNDLIVAGAAILYLVLFLMTLVTWWRWQLRAAHNLRAWGSNYEFTPGWTVGWYFVPFANLVKPFQAMKEIYGASDPRAATAGYRAATAAAGIVVAWWSLWLLGNFLGHVAWRMPDETIHDLRNSTIFSIVEAGLDIPLCLVAAAMIRAVNRNQWTRAERLSAGTV